MPGPAPSLLSRFLAACVGAALFCPPLAAATTPVVDTGQTLCYDATKSVTCPGPGEPFHGQDAQFPAIQPGYASSADGKTVQDTVTGLTWMRGPNTNGLAPVRADKLTYSGAQAWVGTVNAARYGGFSDWRLPTIKELYSLMSFKGTDPSSYTGSDPSALTPFIDRAYFNFAYGQTSTGERLIDSQYASSNVFVVNPAETGSPKLFGLNLADGRIKGYDLKMPDGSEKTFFVQLVRGGSGYGVNGFVDNGDGTVTDRATGLMWTKEDSGSAATWQGALAWVDARNAAGHLGHGDWRMPNAKELQSIVDYSHAPDFDGLPAIDPSFFSCTPITNENGDRDYPYYWTGTTHAGYSPTGSGGGNQAAYIPFGRALGWPDSTGRWVDVHGAGCQRADEKVGPPFPWATIHTVTKNGTTYTGYAFGPQGDAVRGLNFVRPVRDAGKSGACVEDATTLCLLGGRFRVEAAWRNYDGASGQGRTKALTSDTGAFWFSDPANVEVIAKMVSFCSGGSGNVSVYAAGLTDLEVTLTVTDTATGLAKTYPNALGSPFALVRDGPFGCR